MAVQTGNKIPYYIGAIQKRSGTAAVFNKSKAAGIVVDTADGNKLKYNKGGTVVSLVDSSTSGIAGTAASVTGTLAVSETAVGGYLMKTVLTLTAVLVNVADATTGGGTKLYTFPEGGITVLGGSFSLAPTTTSTIATTLKAGVTIEVGLGTASAGSGSLTTTEEDIVTGATGPSSTVINVAAAAIVSAKTDAIVPIDGHTTAKFISLNVGVPTATDIDADATVTFTGTATIIWAFGGDV